MGDIVEFETSNGHQKVFYKISSNAINFEVKACGNAGIGLAKSSGTECDYLIALGNARHSWIKKSNEVELKASVHTPNILSLQEYRRFWVSWYGDSIKVGGEGCSNPIVTCNYKASDMKYVTFFAVAPESHPVHWRVELPPAIESPMPKVISGGELTWVPIDADTIVLPDNVLIGGFENENLYIVRAKHRGSLTPGKFVPVEGSAYISWGGESHLKNVYEVLVGYDSMWVQTSGDQIPTGAFIGGYSENIEHEKLYVGRAQHAGHIIPGKVQPSHKTCYIAYEGREIAVNNYEILVIPWQNKCANTSIKRA